MKERGSISFTAFLFQLVALLLMSLLTLIPDEAKKTKRKKKQQQQSSWDQFKNLLTCKQIQDSKIYDPSRNNSTSCSSICRLRDVRVVDRADNSPESSRRLGQESRLLTKKSGAGSQLRKLSGCYECRAIVDPTRYPLPRTAICVCSQCGEVFPKMESLQHHQAVRHAVSELGPQDSSRNIVEIIFKSSWLKKDNPICKIERILKVHNTPRTIQRFEDYRDGVKIRANSSAKRNARCAADGNELLRFHCATLTCSLGARGSSSLCGSIPACGVCTIIRHGFQGSKINGIRTTASSGRAHDCLGGGTATRRAMLVCRVIAGRVRAEGEEDGGACDSVAGYAGMYSNLEELLVFSSRAILPCFVVIYKALDS